MNATCLRSPPEKITFSPCPSLSLSLAILHLEIFNKAMGTCLYIHRNVMSTARSYLNDKRDCQAEQHDYVALDVGESRRRC